MYSWLRCVITVKWISQLGLSSNFGKACSISCLRAICLHFLNEDLGALNFIYKLKFAGHCELVINL